MSTTRRAFFVRAGAGVAVAGVAAATPALAGGSTTPVGGTDGPVPDASGLATPLVLYVKDAATGELALLVGEREVVFTDRATTNRILAAARG